MKILILTTHMNHGGIAYQIINLAQGLLNMGQEVTIASSGGKLDGLLREKGINTLHIPINTKSELSPRILISLVKLLNNFKSQDIDIVHANTRVTQVLAYLYSSLRKTKYISTAHGFYRPHFTRRLFKLWGHRTIAVSSEVKKHLVEDFKIPASCVDVVYNGIDIPSYGLSYKAREKIRGDFGLKTGKVIGTIARFSEEKGQEYLVRAFDILIKEDPSLKLFMVGEGRRLPAVRRLIYELGLQKYVVIQPAMASGQILPAMDVFCLPSLKEGLGLAILEAQAAGVPVVASMVGGIKEIIEDGETGFLVSPGDYVALSGRIKELLESKELIESFTKKALLRLKQNFSVKKMAEQTLRTYKTILDK